jgi:CO/xanthine dehydrogenase FAD-binding subunit
MKLPPVAYEAPKTVSEAVELLAEHQDEASVLAGGQSLIPLLALGWPSRRRSSTSTASMSCPGCRRPTAGWR